MFVQDYDPTIENMYRKQIGMGDQGACMLEILDTAGQEEYSVMRDQYIRSGDGFLLVYSVDSRSSFDSIPDIRDAVMRVKDVEKVPIVLVATKADLEATRKTTQWEGTELAKSFNCPFVEASAKARTRVEDGFLLLVQQIRAMEEQSAPVLKKKKSAKCSIL